MNVRRLFWIASGLALLVAPSTGPAGAQAQARCGDIASNETWATGSVTQICAEGVHVRGSVLTIQPGAEILMADGASLVIEAGSTLTAVGTPTSEIRFRADTRNEVPGFWGQIRIEAGALPGRLDEVQVGHGGKGGVPMIEVRGTTVTMNNLELRAAADVPVAFTANELGPSLDAAGNVTGAGACTNITVAASNVVPAIGVLGDAAVDVRSSQTWHNFCVPYRVTEELAIGGAPDPDLGIPELRLGVGVQVALSGEGAFKVGVDADNPGQLLTDGTPAEPIRLTSTTRTPGDWYGIEFTEHSGYSGLSNTRVEYGGKGGRPMVVVRSRNVTAVSSTFHNAAGVPLVIVPEAVGPFLASAFLESTPDAPAFGGNGVQQVTVLASEQPVLSRSAEWGDAGVPLFIDDDLYVGGDIVPRLALKPGAHLVFSDTARLVVGDASNGPAEFDVAGTPESPVRLSGTTARPGAWGGVKIGDSPTTARFDYVVLESGGSPMLEWGRASGDVTRSTFRGAAGYPIEVPFSVAHDVILDPVAIDAEPGDDLRCTFEGNGTDRVLVGIERNLTAASASWRDPGAPVEVAGMGIVSSGTTPVLNLHGGLTVLFRPGAGIQLGDGGTGHGGLAVTTGALDGPVVTLEALDPAAGWAGITVLKGSSVNVSEDLVIAGGQVTSGLVIRGIAADAAAVAVTDGRANLDGIAFAGSDRGTGVLASGEDALVTVSASVVSGYRVGLHSGGGAVLNVTRSVVQGNAEWGFLNENGAGPCQLANLVWWGGAQGPKDESAAEDGCVNAVNAGPGADRVSDFVNWWPYAIDTAYTPATGLGPNPRKIYVPYTACNAVR